MFIMYLGYFMVRIYEHLYALIKDFAFLSTADKKKIADKVKANIDGNTYDFGLVQYRKLKGRTVATFLNNNTENVLLRHLFKIIVHLFKIKFSNRDSIMAKVFDIIDIINGNKPALSDFTLVRFDFKDFFYSISTSYIFEKYLKISYLTRENADYLGRFVHDVPYCCAGMSLSNAFAEIIAKDFDEKIKIKLADYNVVLYERFVDDGILVTNKYISETEVKRIILEAIKEVFYDENYDYVLHKNKTKLNTSKFYYLSRRDYASVANNFDFLGYHFSFDSNFDFSFGITSSKIDKYEKKINTFFSKYYSSNPVLTKYFVLCFSSRVIYKTSNSGGWVNKGIVSTYKELRRHISKIDNLTTDFLKNVFRREASVYGSPLPKYLSMSNRYNLYENLKNNKAVIFEQRIGYSTKAISKILSLCGKVPCSKKNYYRLVNQLLMTLELGGLK